MPAASGASACCDQSGVVAPKVCRRICKPNGVRLLRRKWDWRNARPHPRRERPELWARLAGTNPPPPHPVPTAIELRRNGFFPILIVILLLISKNEDWSDGGEAKQLRAVFGQVQIKSLVLQVVAVTLVFFTSQQILHQPVAPRQTVNCQ